MNGYHDKSDSLLAGLVASGNHDAFSEMVTRHTDKYFALAFRTLQHQGDAEDIVQTAFLKFWQRPQMWQPDKSKFTTWFYRVVINACHDHQRRRSREICAEPDVFERALPQTPSEESQADSKQAQSWRQHCLESGVRGLPNSQRDALNLVVYSELPQKQAAEILGVSLKALESLLVRAKRNLRSHVDTLERQIAQNTEPRMPPIVEEPNV